MLNRAKIMTVLAALLVVGVASVALAAPSQPMMEDPPRWGMMDGTDRMMPGDQAQGRDWHDEMHADSERMGQRHDEIHAAYPQMQRHMDGQGRQGPDGSAGSHCSGAVSSTR